MADQPDMVDAAILFRRIRNWSPSGLGMMTGACILHQMGGRPSVDPYGWRDGRIRAAMAHLIASGAIQKCGIAGEYCVTAQGLAQYEGAEAAKRMRPVLAGLGLDQ